MVADAVKAFGQVKLNELVDAGHSVHARITRGGRELVDIEHEGTTRRIGEVRAPTQYTTFFPAFAFGQRAHQRHGHSITDVLPSDHAGLAVCFDAC